MRLIDADALIEKWYEVNDIGPEDRGAIFIGYTEIPRFINNAPTVETTGDYISRADAIEAVAKLCVDGYKAKVDGYFIPLTDALINTLSALPSADAVPQLRQTDTLIIADALRYLAKDTERHLVDRTRADALRQQFLKYGASMCKGGAE